MDSNTVCQQYNTQMHIVHIGDAGPPSDAPILLFHLLNRMIDHVLNPLVPNDGPIGPCSC